jgi:predicted RNA binding protein YcfA (HicA-like mRNA interferase family)
MKVREIIRVLEADGWVEIRQTGSHKHFKHAVKRGLVTVPDHRSKDLGEKTCYSILKQAGLKKGE